MRLRYVRSALRSAADCLRVGAVAIWPESLAPSRRCHRRPPPACPKQAVPVSAANLRRETASVQLVPRRRVRPRSCRGKKGRTHTQKGQGAAWGVTGTAGSAGGWAFGTGLGGGKRGTPIQRAPTTTVRIATLPQRCLTILAPRTMTQQCQTDGTCTRCNPTPYALPRRPATTTAQLLLSLQQLTIATTAAYDYLPTYVANQLTQQQLKWTTTPL